MTEQEANRVQLAVDTAVRLAYKQAYAAGWRAGAEKMREACADTARVGMENCRMFGNPIGADACGSIAATVRAKGVPPVEYPEAARGE